MMKEKENEKEVDASAWLCFYGINCPELQLPYFAVSAGQTWCILASNSSGVNILVDLLSGDDNDCEIQELRVPEDFRVVSFRRQQELFEQEVRNDDSDYIDYPDPGTPAAAFLGNSEKDAELVRLFGLEHVLESGYRQLSSGEGRKLLLLEAITSGARHLLIENPYDGLDLASCSEFDRIIEGLSQEGVKVVVMSSSRYDVPVWCSHLLVLDSGRVVASGRKEEVLATAGHFENDAWRLTALEVPETDKREDELVRLVNGHARYGERQIFSAMNLLVHRGDHTLITGPNGSGKSTLLNLITGDHPDCYSNELYLFGIRRGTGESVWELKKDMGIVSPALHRNHYIPGNALEIVVSGFFDSIGLYRSVTAVQEKRAREWLEVIGLSEHAGTPFRRLGFARQRLVLIARAMIKMPRLLILDEPTHGLDDGNRERLLSFLEMVAEKKLSTILYVSHRLDEYRGFFKYQIKMSAS